MSYNDKVLTYWQKGYDSPNVESHLFRVFGRIFDQGLDITGKNGEKVLDYGCGQGEAARYLSAKGFNVYGVDTSASNIEVCQHKLPELAERFKTIPFTVNLNDDWFNVSYDIVISIQVLYYLNPHDLRQRLQNLYNQMSTGAYIYATMMGSQAWYYEYAKQLDDGMYRVDLKCQRFSLSDYRITFVHSEEELKDIFSLFTPLHVGFYAAKFRSDEGQDFHYTFIGQKS